MRSATLSGRHPSAPRRSDRGPLGALPRLSPAARRALLHTGALSVADTIALIVGTGALAGTLASAVHPPLKFDPLWIVAAMVALRAALSWASATIAERAAASSIEELRGAALDSALRRGPEWIDRTGAAELGTLLNTGLDKLEGYFTSFLPALIASAVTPGLIGVWLLCQDWR
ncbi:MAG: ABC transporter transmembrane domain-containing protein, partial [Sciscionella sp.]